MRSLFRFPTAEKILIASASRSRLAAKLISPEKDYPMGSHRHSVRDGLCYELDISDVIGHALYFYGRVFYPKSVLALIQPADVVLDIGANIGTFTLPAAMHCRHGAVFAFEPDPSHISNLKRNLQLNGLPHVQIVRKALGDHVSEEYLVQVEPNNRGMNRILPQSRYAGRGSQLVNVATLDDEVILLGLHKIDFIKIDVEGFEWFVLKGGSDTIRKFKPVMVIEVIDANLKVHNIASAQVLDLLFGWGYDICDLASQQPIVAGKAVETDILCTHPARSR